MNNPPHHETLESIIHEPIGPANASIIWLHGLGADGHDFETIIEVLELPEHFNARFIFPHAPMRPITINNGMVMRGWYDIREPAMLARIDEEGIQASVEQLSAMIRHEESQKIPAQHIFLGGFSQGGVIALHTGLRYPNRLGGIIALSTYLPLTETLGHECHATNSVIPIFFGHGLHDAIVPLSLANNACDWLKQKQHPVTRHDYPIEHNVCAEEINDISSWLRNIAITAPD